MKIFKNENWPGVKQSLIASVLFLLILDPLIDLIKGIATKGMIALVDYFYFSCGHTSNTEFINTVAYLALIMTFSVISMMLSSVDFPSDEENTTCEKETMDKLPVEEKDPLKEIGDQLSELQNDLIKIDERIKKIKEDKIKSQKRMAIITRILFALCTCLFVIIIVYEYFPLMKKEQFDRSMIQIAPYIDEIELMRLRADWVSMETRDDYLALNKKVQSIMEINGIK